MDQLPHNRFGTGRGDEPPEVSPDAVAVLQGSTFLLSDVAGDVREGATAGLFHRDTRMLSRFRLTLEGLPLRALSSGQTDFYGARFFLVNPAIGELPTESISIERDRFVWDRVREGIVVRSHLNEPIRITLAVDLAADFADLFEVKDQITADDGRVRREHDEESQTMRFLYADGPFEAATVIRFSRPLRLEGDRAVFDIDLPARGEWRLDMDIGWEDGAPTSPDEAGAAEVVAEASEEFRRWRAELPDLEGGSDLLRHVYDRSILDLAGLRLKTRFDGEDITLPAAGLPWFMTIFGRDTLITSYQSILMVPSLARGALRALAMLQGKVQNDFRDEEPGKIMHEVRYGRLTALGRTPHQPYYGSVDATPLWLILLSEYWRVTGDDSTVRELWPAATEAIEWMRRTASGGGSPAGTVVGAPYVTYATRSDGGQIHHGWKDSTRGVLFRDGSPVESPIALCEVQGYAYDAALRVAELAERVVGDSDLAGGMNEWGQALQRRFDQDFWIEDHGGYYALGLDASGNHVDSLTSNIGHLLWSGIVPAERAPAIVDRLFSEELWSGWGVRTAATSELGYNPVAYHNGTVWPHDNTLIAAGLARYGFRREANRIVLAMAEAAEHLAYRLPEAFAGYPRAETGFPVRYATASNPQAWATAAPFLWLRTMLGLEARDGRLVADPLLPEQLGPVALRGLHACGRRWDLQAEGTTYEIHEVTQRKA